MRRFAELGDQGSASNGSAAQEQAATGVDGNSGGSHTLSLLQQALERVVQPLLQSPLATPDQQIAAAEGLAQIAGTLQALAMQAAGAAQPPELARAVAATLAAAVGSQPAADAAAAAAAAAATAAVPAAAQEQLDAAVVSSLAAARALLDVGAGPQGATGTAQPVQAALLSAALAALRGPAASAPQLTALQSFLASAAVKLAASQPKLLAAAAGSLLQAADTAVAEAAVPKNGSGAASTQLQAVLQAVLRWGAALPVPAPAASALPTATGGSGATAAILPVVGEEDHQQPADTSAEAPAQPALELEGQLGAPEQQSEAANEAASPAAEEPAAAAAGSADEAAPEADAAEQQGSRGDAAAEHAADGPSEAADTEAAGVTDAAEAADGAGDWPDEFEGADDSEWVAASATPADEGCDAEAAGAPEAAEQGAGVQPAGDAAEDAVPPPQQPAQPLSADDKAAAAARQRSLQVNGMWPWIVPRGFRLRFASEGRTKSFQLTWGGHAVVGGMTFMGLRQVLAATQKGDSCAAVRLQALSALRAHLGGLAGGAAVNGEAADAAYAWAAAAMQAMVPPAAAHAHLLLEQQRQSVAEDMQVCCLEHNGPIRRRI